MRSIKKYIKVIIGLCVGLFFLLMLSKQVSWQDILDLWPIVKWHRIPIVLSIYVMAMGGRIVRWRLLLDRAYALTLKQVSEALIIGYAANNVLPAKLGELYRVDFCKREYKCDRSYVLGTIVIERFFDVIVALLLLAIGIKVLMTTKGYGQHITAVNQVAMGAGAFMFAIAGGILLVTKWHWLINLLNRWQFLAAKVARIKESLQLIFTSIAWKVLLLSIFIWALEAVCVRELLYTVAVELTILQTLLVIGLACFSTLIPAPPGYLGTLQYAYVLGVTAFGYTVAQGVMGALLVQVFLLIPVAVVGALLLFKLFLQKQRKLCDV